MSNFEIFLTAFKAFFGNPYFWAFHLGSLFLLLLLSGDLSKYYLNIKKKLKS